jgi:hypothetical protein
MVRVYAALKARIMAGDFPPGERLDPAALAGVLNASATPVRDALYRLTGERLIESWQHEGFHIPVVTEASLREIYQWSGALMEAAVGMAIRMRKSLPVGPNMYAGLDRSPLDVAVVFDAIALATQNPEVYAAVSNLNDRCSVMRSLETGTLRESENLVSVITAIAAGNWSSVRSWLKTYHRERMRTVQQIGGMLRPRNPGAG